MSFFLALLPHAFAKRVERFYEYRRLGLEWGHAIMEVASIAAWSSYREARLDLLPDGFAHEEGCVIDVGANCGDWSECILRFLKHIQLIAIEPNPPVFAGLVQRLHLYPSAKVLNLGASSHSGELPFYVTSGSQCASLLRPSGEMTSLYGASFNEEKTITVKVETLDTILADYVAIALLKIDVQGYEREALAGASAVLARTRCVLVEINYVSHYENDIQFAELDALMLVHGFVLSNLSRPFIRQGRALWADALYCKQ